MPTKRIEVEIARQPRLVNEILQLQSLLRQLSEELSQRTYETCKTPGYYRKGGKCVYKDAP